MSVLRTRSAGLRPLIRARRRGPWLMLAAFLVLGSVVAVWQVYEWRERVRESRGVVLAPPAPPLPGSVAVYAYGDSTMVGDPYRGELDIPKVVSYCLRGRVGRLSLEIQNLAYSGNHLVGNPPAAIYEVLDDLERYRPAAVLLYIGHMDHAYTPQSEVESFSTPGDPDPIATRFGRELRELAQRAHEVGVPLLIGIPVANNAGWPPWESRHGGDCSAEAARQVERAVAAACRLLDEGDASGALRLLDDVLPKDPGYADSYFYRGVALRALGRDEEARRSFVEAVDRDQSVRATSRQCDAILALCEEGLAICVDPRPAITAHYGFMDDRVFADVHHPLATGYGIIGQAFAEALAPVLGAQPPRRIDPDHLPPELDPGGRELPILLRRATWFLEAAESGRELVRGDVLRRADEWLREAEGLVTTRGERLELATRQAMLAAMRGNPDEAERFLDMAQEEPAVPAVEEFMSSYHVINVFENHGVDL